jgi:hypothetical protein
LCVIYFLLSISDFFYSLFLIIKIRFTFLINKEGILVSSWQNSVQVTKGGVGAYLYDYSKKHSFLYGVFAALGAIILGFTASEIFRRI